MRSELHMVKVVYLEKITVAYKQCDKCILSDKSRVFLVQGDHA